MECDLILGSKALRIGRKIGGKLLIGRLGCGHVLGHKFHLLPHTTAYDDVVPVQAGRSALAVEHLVANVVLDQALQFLLARKPPPRPRESVAEVGDPRGGNNDFLGRVGFLLVDQMKDAKESRAEHQKLEQRLSQKRKSQGVYQIGEV